MREMRIWGFVIIGALAIGCDTSGDDDDDLPPGEGYSVGDTLPGCELTNQDGDTTSTHDAEGDRILLTVGAEWCEPCAEAADDAEALNSELGAGGGFTMFEVLIQDANWGEDVSQSVLQDWQDDHGLTSVDVWTDGVESCVDPFATAGELPVFVIVDETLVIREIITNGYNETVEQQIIDTVNGL